MADIVAPAVPEAQDRGRVRDVQESNARSHHAVKRGRGSQVEKAKSTDNEAANVVRHEWHVEGLVDL